VSDSLEEDIAVILEHYGTKGMKWGVRKADESHASVSVATRTSKTGKAKISTKGGKGEAASKDAIDARVIKQTYRKSGTNALSNDELRALTTRLQLEKQVNEVASPTGKKVVKNFLFRNGRQTADRAYQEGVTNRVAGAIKDAMVPKVPAPPTLFD
jgi:hypothetical protein